MFFNHCRHQQSSATLPGPIALPQLALVIGAESLQLQLPILPQNRAGGVQNSVCRVTIDLHILCVMCKVYYIKSIIASAVALRQLLDLGTSAKLSGNSACAFAEVFLSI
jgi:hypothetical protein